MKKSGILVLIILVFSAVSFSSANEVEEDEPYYVFSDSPAIKALLKVSRNFENGVFSADLSKSQLNFARGLQIKLEPVSVYTINDNPCRNDKECAPDYYCDKSQSVRGMGICKQKNGGDESINPEPEVRKCFPSAQKPWGINRVNGGIGGQGIKVAVLDTGIMTGHHDLKSRISLCESKVTRFNADKDNCEDGHGHGTHVAGIVAADSGNDKKGIYGVAPDAELIVVKVCDRRGNCYGDDIAAGIRYAADNGANIISMSLGGSSLSTVERSAVDYAVEKGVLVIAAAGNSGPDLNTINYPAAYFKAISVGAIDSNNRVADYSSRGIGVDQFEEKERYLEVSAPGSSISSTWIDGCYRVLSGTSMATPHVSGIAAILWSSNNSLSSFEVREKLRDNSEDIIEGIHSGAGYDPASGVGMVHLIEFIDYEDMRLNIFK
jgi:subtilisin family serine protease